MKFISRGENTNIINPKLKSSRRRNAIIKAFAECKGHLTVDELYERAKRLDSNIGFTTVWRTLKLLESQGQAVSRKFNDGFTRYECVQAQKHHDHLICIACNKIEEFINPRIEEIQKRVASVHKFHMTAHVMELYGYCSKCVAKNKKGAI